MKNQSPRPSRAAIAAGAACFLACLGYIYYAEAHVRITTDLTWSEDIRPIFEQKCMPCHSPGGIAPGYVDLTIYGSEPGKSGARDWAKAIEEEIMTGRMPPWPADARFERYANHRALTKEEKQYIIAWINGGAPQGPRRGLGPPEAFAARKWELGEPTIVGEAPEDYVLEKGKREGETSFSFKVPDDFGLDKLGKKLERRWITGYEFFPGNPKIIHTMQAFIADPPGGKQDEVEVEVQLPYDPLASEDALEQKRMRPLQQGTRFLGQWVRGDAPVLFPPDAGRALRPGSTIEVRVKYRKQGIEDAREEFRDRSKLGIHLAAEPVEFIVESVRMANEALAIEPGAANQEARLSMKIDEGVHIFGLHPRMGYLGKDLKVRATFPDGMEKIILHIPKWQYKWASSFYFDEPIAAPAGTQLEMIARFDNSAENKDNPNRPPQKSAETLEAWIDATADDHMFIPTPIPTPGPTPAQGSGMIIGRSGLFDPLPEDAEGAEPTPAPAEGGPPTDIASLPNVADALNADAAKAQIEKDLAKEVFWCPMRGNGPGQCGIKDYPRQGKCEVCEMELKPKAWFIEVTPPDQFASRTGTWELTEEGKEKIWWSPNRGRNGVPLRDFAEPGVCPDTGVPLLHKSQFKQPRQYMCANPACEEHKKNSIFFAPGKCPACLDPVASTSHMDHNPKHGGVFFMAENNYHHLEGTLPKPREFRLHFYDDLKKDMDARNFAGKVVIEKFNEQTEEIEEKEYPFQVVREGDPYLVAYIPEVKEFPIDFVAKVFLAGKESLFSFRFDALTQEPDAAAAAAVGGIGGHMHVWTPPAVPESPVETVREILKRREIVREKVQAKAWLEIHAPAFDAKHLAESLRAKREGLPARKRDDLRKAIAKIVEGAIYLERYSHENDGARVNMHFRNFSEGIDGLVAVFPEAAPKPADAPK